MTCKEAGEKRWKGKGDIEKNIFALKGWRALLRKYGRVGIREIRRKAVKVREERRRAGHYDK